MVPDGDPGMAGKRSEITEMSSATDGDHVNPVTRFFKVQSRKEISMYPISLVIESKVDLLVDAQKLSSATRIEVGSNRHKGGKAVRITFSGGERSVQIAIDVDELSTLANALRFFVSESKSDEAKHSGQSAESTPSLVF
jgi:hypothetical protein